MTTIETKQTHKPVHQKNTKTVLKYGLFLGFVLCVIIVLRMLLNMPLKQPVSNIELIVFIVGLFMFSFIYRKKLDGQSVSFKRMFLFNLKIGLTVTIIYSIFIIVYAQYIDTEFCNRYFELQQTTFAKMKLSPQEITQKTEELKHVTAKNLGTLSFILLLLWSSLFSAVTALFMRTQKNK